MDMDRYIGRLLDGRYEIMEVIGVGGMAVVYKARCHRLNRLVAVKILKDELTQDEEFRRRFHAESQAVAALSHPNIVSVYDVSTSDDADFIVMELIDGITLKQYMEKKGVLNWKETLHFAIQIAKALDHAHSRGIIHRDIKPHNVMVLKNGSVKVADFGIAQVMTKSNTLTKEALGSVHYISPEQAKGGRVDNRSDLYSLGVVMYEMMAGRPPYDGETPVAVAIQHINGKAALPTTLNPNIPGGLEQIIMRAMAQDPAERYSTATAMLYDMDEFRKDPTVLFDYNNASTGLDDAARIVAAPAAEPAAEKPAEPAKEPETQRPVRKSPPPPSPAKKKRRTEEIVEDEDRGGKVATVAVVIFALVAVIAIGLMGWQLLEWGASLNSGENKILLPNLENMTWEDVVGATDYVVRVEKYAYSDIYAKDRIISQKPEANTSIEKGDTVYVVISAGPEPQEKLMENLVGLDEAQAISFLTATQGVDSKLILRFEENSQVEAGTVIRTDPVEGEPLPENSAIKLYISKGPAVKRVTMVDLTSDFYNEESAINWLIKSGFTNYRIVEVQSDKPVGKVIYQSEVAGTQVDVTTTIILQVSRGMETEPTVPPTVALDPEDYVSKVVTVELPEALLTNIPEGLYLSIYRSDDMTLVEERDILPGTVSIQVTLTGKDKMTFLVQPSVGDGWVIEVDFASVVEPEVPVGPGGDDPDVPDVPDTPDVPDVPDTPNVPAAAAGRKSKRE